MSVKLTNEYKIVVSANADAGTKYAAEELTKYLKAIGGVELPIVCDCTEPVDKEIVIGCTSRPGIFASGDAVLGARTVVEAVANSKRVAEAMHEYMQSLPLPVTTDYPDAPVVTSIEAAAQAEQVL